MRPDPAESAAGLPRRAAVNLSALARGPAMRGPAVRALLLLLLLLSPPAGAWYKHVASPRYHTVGRAAGLLMGLRRSPYVWRRALRPVAGSLAWDTQGLGASPQRLFAKDTLSPEPIPRGALLLSSGVRELLETGSGNPSAGLGVSAPWSQHATEPQQELEPRLGAPSWTRVKQARYVGRERGRGPQRVEDVWGNLRAHEKPHDLPISHFLPRKVFLEPPTLPIWER